MYQMLWLYMDDPFLMREGKPIADYKKKLVAELEDERFGSDALFPRSRSMEKSKEDPSKLGKVCSGNIEEIWNDEL